MKFALNHKHRFDSPFQAFISSMLLFVLMIWLEVVNFLLVLNTENLNDLIQNVTALVIIAEADVLLYNVLSNEVLKDILKLFYLMMKGNQSILPIIISDGIIYISQEKKEKTH